MKTLIAAACVLGGLAEWRPALGQETRPATPLTAPGTGQPATPSAGGGPYDPAADAEKDLAAAVARARTDHSRVLVVWGANWCSWCKLLHGTMRSDEAIARELLYEYEVVRVDVGRFDKHQDLAKRLGADLQGNGLPFLSVLDGEGTVIVHQETGSLEAKDATKPSHDAATVLEFLKKHRATHPSGASLLADARARAKAQDKRVLVHLGAPWCGWCTKLETWMERPEVAAILDREFVPLKIDVDRAPDGKALQASWEAARAGLPWTCVLDDSGTVLAHSGLGDNVGFPATPEEISKFGAMLRTVKNHLTDADIEALLSTLALTNPK